MARYMIERQFPKGLSIPQTDEGKKAIANVVANNAEHGVTWVHSYVNPDRTATFCVYDGPSPEAIRKVADRNEPAGDEDHPGQRPRSVLLHGLKTPNEDGRPRPAVVSVTYAGSRARRARVRRRRPDLRLTGAPPGARGRGGGCLRVRRWRRCGRCARRSCRGCGWPARPTARARRARRRRRSAARPRRP